MRPFPGLGRALSSVWNVILVAPLCGALVSCVAPARYGTTGGDELPVDDLPSLSGQSTSRGEPADEWEAPESVPGGRERELDPLSPREVDVCPGGLDATFVQLTSAQRRYDVDQWRDALRMLESVWVRTVFVQFTGNSDGSYEGRDGQTPIANLLAAAEDLGFDVWLGLYSDHRWPWSWDFETDVVSPLDDPDASAELAALCNGSSACAGWYLPNEVEDLSWGDDPLLVRGMLADATAVLDALTPGKPVAIAPYFGGRRTAAESAAFFRDALTDSGVDVVMPQDMVGVGRATADLATDRLNELRPFLDALDIELRTTPEVFHQTHGWPYDDLEFAAEPATIETVSNSLDLERDVVEHATAFEMFYYMNADGSEDAQRLHADYLAWCAEKRGG